jgi:hypothetical protein
VGKKMSDELNQQILEELKKINGRLQKIEERRGLSTPVKFIAIIVGFVLIGPLLSALLLLITRLFN